MTKVSQEETIYWTVDLGDNSELITITPEQLEPYYIYGIVGMPLYHYYRLNRAIFEVKKYLGEVQ